MSNQSNQKNLRIPFFSIPRVFLVAAHKEEVTGIISNHYGGNNVRDISLLPFSGPNIWHINVSP